MAADGRQAADGDFKIAQHFTQHYYSTWEQYILQQDPSAINSPKTEILALLCILGYKFSSDGRDYEKSFFDLFCHALGGPSYRRKPKKLRPRLFKYPPSHLDGMKFCFVWPVAFKVLQDGGDITNTFHVGIPSQYLYTAAMEGQPESQSGSLCTMLYLVMTDVAASFWKSMVTYSKKGTAMSQVECPCLLDYFKRSSENNRNNLSALIGEYLAFLNTCFELEYHETSSFTPVHKGDDFNVFDGHITRKFSVKTNNSGKSLRLFAEEIWDPSTNAPVNPDHALSDATVLILNCSCSDCKLNPTVLLAPGANYPETCKRSQAREFIEELYGTADTGQHYLTSLCNYFDLRFAMWSFNHRSFRDGQQFKGRCEFIACFKSRVACEDWCDNSCLRWS